MDQPRMDRRDHRVCFITWRMVNTSPWRDRATSRMTTLSS